MMFPNTFFNLKGKELWLIKKPEKISTIDLTEHVRSLKKRHLDLKGTPLRLRRFTAPEIAHRLSVAVLGEDNCHHLCPGLELVGTIVMTSPQIDAGNSSRPLPALEEHQSTSGSLGTHNLIGGEDFSEAEFGQKLVFGPPPIGVELRQRFVPFGCGSCENGKFLQNGNNHTNRVNIAKTEIDDTESEVPKSHARSPKKRKRE